MPMQKKNKFVPTTFTFRADPAKWKDLNLILTLKEKTPTEFFTSAMEKLLEENRTLLDSVLHAIKSANQEGDAHDD
jgi:hypothetical protein